MNLFKTSYNLNLKGDLQCPYRADRIDRIDRIKSPRFTTFKPIDPLKHLFVDTRFFLLKSVNTENIDIAKEKVRIGLIFCARNKFL